MVANQMLFGQLQAMLLQAITSPMAVNRFKELYGVDLPQFLNRVIAENKDPIEEMVMLINHLTGGDVFKVSEIFRNKTDLNFLKPMMQNLDEYRRIKASALGADGIMDRQTIYLCCHDTARDSHNKFKGVLNG